MGIHRPSDKVNKLSKHPELLQQDDSVNINIQGLENYYLLKETG